MGKKKDKGGKTKKRKESGSNETDDVTKIQKRSFLQVELKRSTY